MLPPHVFPFPFCLCVHPFHSLQAGCSTAGRHHPLAQGCVPRGMPGCQGGLQHPNFSGCFGQPWNSQGNNHPSETPPAPLLVFRASAPLPCLCRGTSGCECLIPSPALTPAEPTLPTKITPRRSHPSAHPRLRDLFFISSWSPLSPTVRCKGLAADPIHPVCFPAENNFFRVLC